MNYYEIINACLSELNYKTVTSFDLLTKQEHKKIMSLVNRVNSDVCSSYDWEFTLRKVDLPLTAGVSSLELPSHSKIVSVYVDNSQLAYVHDAQSFFCACPSAFSYTVFHSELLLAPFTSDKTVTVFFASNNYACDADGADIPSMVSEADCSVIPMPFREGVLVYGACLLYKANPAHPKYKHWYSAYIRSISAMRSASFPTYSGSPRIVIK